VIVTPVTGFGADQLTVAPTLLIVALTLIGAPGVEAEAGNAVLTISTTQHITANTALRKNFRNNLELQLSSTEPPNNYVIHISPKCVVFNNEKTTFQVLQMSDIRVPAN